MFYKPIDLVRGLSEEGLFKWAQRICFNHSVNEKKVYLKKGNKIYFIDEEGNLYLAVFRTEIPELFEVMGYKEVANFKEIKLASLMNCVELEILFESNAFKWRCKLAEQMYWDEARKAANQIYRERGGNRIDSINLKDLKYEEITQTTELDGIIIKPVLITAFREGKEVDEEKLKEVVGTYVILDENSVCICDEYARTFLVSGSIEVISDFINELSYYFLYMTNPEELIELV